MSLPVRLLSLALAAGAVAALPAHAAGEESTTFSGKMFTDLSNIDLTKDGVKQTANGTGVDVKRFYAGITHNFDETWSANLTTDFNYSSPTSETQLFVKKAYLQGKFSDALVARLGSADLPWVPFVEDLYGYRYVENVLVDRLKFGTSADWGLHAGGKAADGLFSYAASVVNGAGYKNPTRSKSMDFEGRVAFMPVTGLTLAAGLYSGKLGKDVQNTTTYHTADRFDLLAAYVNGPLRVGAEYFQATNWSNVLTAASDKADGYSAWASYSFAPQWAVFARADEAKTSKTLNANLKDEYYNAGVSYKPRKNLDISLAFKHDQVKGGTISTSNGTIGGVAEGKFNEVGLWAQVAF